MIRKIIGGLCLLLISIAASAQQAEANRAIIYTYDGSVFIGHILQEDDLIVEFKTSTKDRIFIQKGLIKIIRREADQLLIHPGGKVHHTGGRFLSSTLGWGGDFADNPSADWDLIFGQRVNKRFSLGLGMSLSFNSATIPVQGWADHHFIPVFAYGRYYLNDNRVRLFAFSRLGYGFEHNTLWADEHTGGLHFQPGIGLHFAARKVSRFVITVGQMIQHTKGMNVNIDPFSNPIQTRYSYWYNRTVLKIGFDLDSF